MDTTSAAVAAIAAEVLLAAAVKSRISAGGNIAPRSITPSNEKSPRSEAPSADIAGRLADRLADQFGVGSVFKDLASLSPGANFVDAIRDEIAAGKMDVSLEPRGIVLALRDGAFFRSGEDVIDPAAFASLGRMAAVIAPLPNTLLLEGHTDSTPIHNARFRNNWMLSTARSVAVLSLLEARWGIPAGRFEIAGYADNQPRGDNETDAGRARNRRVDIVIAAETPAAR